MYGPVTFREAFFYHYQQHRHAAHHLAQPPPRLGHPHPRHYHYPPGETPARASGEPLSRAATTNTPSRHPPPCSKLQRLLGRRSPWRWLDRSHGFFFLCESKLSLRVSLWENYKSRTSQTPSSYSGSERSIPCNLPGFSVS